MGTADAVSLSVPGVCELHTSSIRAPKWQLNSPADDALPGMCHSLSPGACSTPFTLFQRPTTGESDIDTDTESQQAGEWREEGEESKGRE